MDNIWVYVGLILCTLLLGSGVPIFVAFSVGGGLIMLIHFGMTLENLAQVFFSSVDHEGLLAIPFFILAGMAMTSGGASARLLKLINAFIGHKIKIKIRVIKVDSRRDNSVNYTHNTGNSLRAPGRAKKMPNHRFT